MTFRHSDLDRLAHIMTDAAATEIMPRFRALEQGGIREKSSALDLVTDADEKAEWRMRDAIAKAFPNALFVGEESVERDPSLLARIADADLAVIIDPVDGTSNFAWGLPLFGVLGAVAVRGETVAGLIYDPIGGDWRKGLRGEGAWRETVDGKTADLRVAPAAPVSEMTGVTSWYLMPEPMRSHVAANLAKVQAGFAYRCAAYEYRLVADGLVHFMLAWKLMPWDHAAGLLIHAEAGGFAACLDGTPYTAARQAGGVMSAPDRASWEELRQALFE